MAGTPWFPWPGPPNTLDEALAFYVSKTDTTAQELAGPLNVQVRDIGGGRRNPIADGADPSGILDSATAFEAAATTVGDGGEVIVTGGTYRFTRGLSFAAQGLKFRAHGEVNLVFEDHATRPVTLNNSGCSFEGFTVSRTWAGTPDFTNEYGYFVYSPQGVDATGTRVERCSVTGMGGVSLNGADYAVVQDNTFVGEPGGAPTSWYGVVLRGCDVPSVVRNVVADYEVGGIKITQTLIGGGAELYGSGGEVSFNKVFRCRTQDGIDMYSSGRRASVIGNYVEACKRGIQVKSYGVIASADEYVKHVLVALNMCVGNGLGILFHGDFYSFIGNEVLDGTDATYSGIVCVDTINTPQGIILNGNRVKGGPGWGYYLAAGMMDVDLTANHAEDCLSGGIYSGANHTTITGGTIRNCGSSATAGQRIGVRIVGTSTAAIIKGVRVLNPSSNMDHAFYLNANVAHAQLIGCYADTMAVSRFLAAGATTVLQSENNWNGARKPASRPANADAYPGQVIVDPTTGNLIYYAGGGVWNNYNGTVA